MTRRANERGGSGPDLLDDDDGEREQERQHDEERRQDAERQGNQRHGANAPTLEVPVPPGTVAEGRVGSDAEARWDLTVPGQRAVVARGGSGAGVLRRVLKLKSLIPGIT